MQKKSNSNIFEEEWLELLEDSETGRNKGIPWRSVKLTKILGGVTPSTYYVMLAESSVGKTRFAYDLFWLSPLEYCMEEGTDREEGDVEVVIFALEIQLNKTLAIMFSRWAAQNKDLWITDKDVIGTEKAPPKDLLSLARSKEFLDYQARIQKHTKFKAISDPKKLIAYLTKFCESKTEYLGKNASGKPIYKFKNKKYLPIVIIDHLGNLVATNGDNERVAIKILSKDLKNLRNKYGLTILALQQANPSHERDLIPKHEDSRGSKDPFIDADVVFGIGNPYSQNRKTVPYKGGMYVINDPTTGIGLKNLLRLIRTEKVRYGDLTAMAPYKFKGGQSLIYDMPSPENINYNNL